jgi:hypothetical protein
MANLKNLKELPSNNINVVSLLENIIPNDKPKYKELLFKLVASHVKDNDKHILEEFTEYFSDIIDLPKLSPMERRFLLNLILSFDADRLRQFKSFIDYDEKSLIERNDLSSYKNFNEVEVELTKTELKLISKEMEGQVVTLYNDDEWLFIKPLTYDSSKKYGSNTKWCTTSYNHPDHFFRYTTDGILVYCINKLTGYKVAGFKDINSTDINFYDQVDTRIDSLSCEIPDDLFKILRKHFKECETSNADLIDEVTRLKDIKKYSQRDLKETHNGEMPGVPLGHQGRHRLVARGIGIEEPMPTADEFDFSLDEPNGDGMGG